MTEIAFAATALIAIGMSAAWVHAMAETIQLREQLETERRGRRDD